MPYCPQCGNEVSASAKYCPSCGEEVPATIREDSDRTEDRSPTTNQQARPASRETSGSHPDHQSITGDVAGQLTEYRQSRTKLATALGGIGMLVSLPLPWLRFDPGGFGPSTSAAGTEVWGGTIAIVGGIIFIAMAVVPTSGWWSWIKAITKLVVGGVFAFFGFLLLSDPVGAAANAPQFGYVEVGGHTVPRSAIESAEIGLLVFALSGALVFVAGIASVRNAASSDAARGTGYALTVAGIGCGVIALLLRPFYLIAWVLLPIGIYLDSKYVRRRYPGDMGWMAFVIGAVLPIVNLLVGIVYLLQRPTEALQANPP